MVLNILIRLPGTVFGQSFGLLSLSGVILDELYNFFLLFLSGVIFDLLYKFFLFFLSGVMLG
jgi:hypothetical protein